MGTLPTTYQSEKQLPPRYLFKVDGKKGTPGFVSHVQEERDDLVCESVNHEVFR